MVAEGAVGETRKGILGSIELVEEFDLSQWSNIVESILGDDSIKVLVGNSVWTKNGANVLDSFKKILVSRYNAEQHTISTVEKVNEWVEKRTEGMIPKILGNLSPNAFMLLVNSIYFKGDWKYKFDASLTHPGRFTASDGTCASHFPFPFPSRWACL